MKKLLIAALMLAAFGSMVHAAIVWKCSLTPGVIYSTEADATEACKGEPGEEEGTVTSMELSVEV